MAVQYINTGPKKNKGGRGKERFARRTDDSARANKERGITSDGSEPVKRGLAALEAETVQGGGVNPLTVLAFLSHLRILA